MADQVTPAGARGRGRVVRGLQPRADPLGRGLSDQDHAAGGRGRVRVRLGAVHRASAGSRPRLAGMALPDGPAGGVAASARDRRAHPIRDVEDEPDGNWVPVDPHDQYAIRDGVEDAFSVLEHLSPRLQRIAMLRALGLRHAEISKITGDTPTRVAQLIAQANMRIYEHLEERSLDTERLSPRAKRLWELERDHLAGLRPGSAVCRSRHAAAPARARSAAHGAVRRSRSTTTAPRSVVVVRRSCEVPPADPDHARLHELARRAVDNLTHVRGRCIGRGLGD